MRSSIKKANRIVIKIGTSSITYENGKLNIRQIERLTEVLTDLSNSGKEIVLVTSGAIGAGIGKLGLSSKPTSLESKQATAAIGQAYLMQIYQNFFAKNNQICAQILLTKDVLDMDIKRNNVERTFEELFRLGVIPIVNENDTVSTDEIIGEKFSDNDNLSAIVAVLIEADLLIILSDIDGVHRLIDGKLSCDVIDYIGEVNQEIYGLINKDSSRLGTGGMESKLNAVKYAMENNVDTLICNSNKIENIYNCLEGKQIGTFFKEVK